MDFALAAVKVHRRCTRSFTAEQAIIERLVHVITSSPAGTLSE